MAATTLAKNVSKKTPLPPPGSNGQPVVLKALANGPASSTDLIQHLISNKVSAKTFNGLIFKMRAEGLVTGNGKGVYESTPKGKRQAPQQPDNVAATDWLASNEDALHADCATDFRAPAFGYQRKPLAQPKSDNVVIELRLAGPWSEEPTPTKKEKSTMFETSPT